MDYPYYSSLREINQGRLYIYMSCPKPQRLESDLITLNNKTFDLNTYLKKNAEQTLLKKTSMNLT